MNIREEILEVFKLLFKREPEFKRIENLCKFFGEKKVLAILTYLSMADAMERKEGVRDNPYGLIYTLGRNKKFNWSEFDLTSK